MTEEEKEERGWKWVMILYSIIYLLVLINVLHWVKQFDNPPPAEAVSTKVRTQPSIITRELAWQETEEEGEREWQR